jgi:four helix bundle protein
MRKARKGRETLTPLWREERVLPMQETRNPIRENSSKFAVGVVKFCLRVQEERREQEEKREYVVTKQLLTSGTSVGATVEEAQQPQSRAEVISTMSIALQEAYESRFWLRLIRDSGLAVLQEMGTLVDQIDEIIRLPVTITTSSTSK